MDEHPDLPPVLTRNLEAIDMALRAYIGDDSTELDAAARYALGWEDSGGVPSTPGAKRIRPALCLFAAECCGNDVTVALPGAVALELIHNFSLVHDDIQDRDQERHSRPTLWVRLGEAQAINAGDFLFTSAVRSLATASAIPDAQRTRALDSLTSATTRMIRGQWMDLRFETAPPRDENEYFSMVAGKTGALLGASVAVGAILGGASDEDAATFRRWGEALGLAFQAHDDILGAWGNSAVTGKSNTSDIARKKRSLPIIIAMQDEAARQVIEREYADDEPDVSAVMAALESSGARARTEAIAAEYAERARELVATVPASPGHRDELAEVTHYVVNRTR